jgi:putative heme-binding domain-containing protein
MQAMAAFNDPAIPGVILRNWNNLRAEDRAGAVATLASRPAYAKALLKAVAEGKIARADISAFNARQIHSFGDAQLSEQLNKVWGEVRATAKDKEEQIARYRNLIKADTAKAADPARGRRTFNQVCATCHILYGEGQPIGPDLTGGNRDNLDYLLENILDPSAIVAADYRMSVVTLKDGRVITGLLRDPTARVVAVKTQTEQLKLDRDEIASTRSTAQSLMPDGLLTSLNEDQVRDLFAYLMSRQQVPLPAGADKQ